MMRKTPVPSEAQPAYLGVDVGGTAIKVVVTDERAQCLATFSRATFSGGTAMGTMNALITDAIAAARISGHEPRAMGVCMPGTIDTVAGVVGFAANLGWKDVPVVHELQQRHQLSVYLQHDARAAAEAEASARGLDRSRDMLFVPVGTGVSAALLRHGRVVQGASGGELGHVIVYPDGEACMCGQRGCVEAYAGGAGLLRRYHREGGTAESVADLVASMDRDLIARLVWVDAIDALARGIHASVALFDPEIVVIGGGLASSGERLLGPLKSRLKELLTWRHVPVLSLSVLGASAGLIGALALALPHGPTPTSARMLAEALFWIQDRPVDRGA